MERRAPGDTEELAEELTQSSSSGEEDTAVQCKDESI
ncbi:unnamed protein product [Cylicostephanus goldi]|uniref:Uncharacterized protein n=1 Tax=Cylicostephanus goldi TaxID=71465 RepID=A0A3P6T0Z0_CYLGO|nr:unnamed protein product [Cylicostephanus goldi]